MKKISLSTITGWIGIGLLFLFLFIIEAKKNHFMNSHKMNIGQEVIQHKKHPIITVPMPYYDLKKFHIHKLPTNHKQVNIIELIGRN